MSARPREGSSVKVFDDNGTQLFRLAFWGGRPELSDDRASISYLNPSDSAKHERAIEFLARESQVPVIQVEQPYEREFGILKLGARITAFLDILTSRKVRDTLRRQGSPLPTISERLRNQAIQ